MAEYIEREAAIEAAIDAADEWDGGYNPHRAAQIRDGVKAIPAADVRPVTHERWKAFDFHTVACSGCGFKVDIMAVPSYVLHHLYHCPNCGADMQKESGEEDV